MQYHVQEVLALYCRIDIYRLVSVIHAMDFTNCLYDLGILKPSLVLLIHDFLF